MKAFLIDPHAQRVSEVQVYGWSGVRAMLDCDLLDRVALVTPGAVLAVDEVAVLKTAPGYFSCRDTTDGLRLFAGHGVVVGVINCRLADAPLSLDEVRSKIVWPIGGGKS